MVKSLISLALWGMFFTAAACGSAPNGSGDGDGGAESADANCGAGIFQGCACDPAVDQPVSCFDGPGEAADNPPCMKGTRSCDAVTSTWSACGGQVLPGQEICDMEDNDCDGEIDESVQSACGNCLPGCDGAGVDTDPFPMPPADPNVDADGVGLDPNGDLVLDSSTVENHYLWVANDRQGTVTKLDTRTGKELGRYPSVSHEVIIDHTGGNGNAVPVWNADSNNDAYADNRPSRTAVDYKGDVWVANRAPSRQPSATKILNVEADCTDRNQNSQIDTSRDVNSDGVIDITDPAEFLGEADECIAFTVAIGTMSAWGARAVAIDQGVEPGDPGDAWVGMFTDKAFFELDGKTGALKQRVPATGPGLVSPYGAAIDSQGRLWAPDGCCGNTQLLQLNTLASPADATTVPVPALGGEGSYGIVVDLADRVWIGAWPNGSLKRYDPATQQTVEVQIPDHFGNGWGVRGVGLDTHGNIWAALHVSGVFSGGRVARIDADTATADGYWDIVGVVPVGVGVDFDGDVWTVNQQSSNASRVHIDQTLLEPAAHPITGNIVDVFPVGPNPYTYSDFTGLGLRTVTRPRGDYVVPIQGCADGDPATWLGVEWTSTLPPNTNVQVWVRTGDDLATLNAQPIYGPWEVSPADLQAAPGPVPDGTYLQLTIRLLSDDNESTPIVHGYSVQWSCPPEPVD